MGGVRERRYEVRGKERSERIERNEGETDKKDVGGLEKDREREIQRLSNNELSHHLRTA